MPVELGRRQVADRHQRIDHPRVEDQVDPVGRRARPQRLADPELRLLRIGQVEAGPVQPVGRDRRRTARRPDDLVPLLQQAGDERSSDAARSTGDDEQAHRWFSLRDR
jgi:hypothetical protein